MYMRQHTKADPTPDDVAMYVTLFFSSSFTKSTYFPPLSSLSPSKITRKYMMWSFEMASYKMMKETSGERYKMVWFVSNDGYNPKYMRSMKFVKELTNNVQVIFFFFFSSSPKSHNIHPCPSSFPSPSPLPLSPPLRATTLNASIDATSFTPPQCSACFGAW